MGWQQRGSAESLQAGTWIWWVGADRFLGDKTVSDIFDVDEVRLKDGVTASEVCAAIHPEDLPGVLQKVQTSIEEDVPYRAWFRVRRSDGLVRHVMSVGQCFLDEDRLLQFVGTTIPILSTEHREASLDQLTEQVIVARETAQALGEPFRVHLLDMVLADIGKATATGMLEATILLRVH